MAAQAAGGFAFQLRENPVAGRDVDTPAHVFRPDIEALRAIAVAAVVLYHAGVPGFSGGFVGVDIFFAISGYLITGLLVRELERTATIDLIAFWARRAWRLLPNALLVVAATLVASFWLVPQSEQSALGHAALATLAYVANFHFAARAVDYFDDSHATSPFLHYWSLGVEEQFYIALPCLLLLLARGRPPLDRRRLAWVLAAIAALSFAAGLIWLRRSQPHAFFHTEARVWQLAAGGLLALGLPAAAFPVAARRCLTWVGLAAMLAAVALLDQRMPYPGVLALLPVLATLAVIAGGAETGSVAGRVMMSAPFQWLGRRSYSVYLWHWPVLVLGPALLPDGAASKALLLTLVLITATAAFHLVEDPLRRFAGRAWPRGRRLAAPLLASLPVAVLAVATLYWGAFSSSEWAAVLARIDAARLDAPGRTARPCTPEAAAAPTAGCAFGDVASTRRVVLIGDSFAANLIEGLDVAARNAGWRLEQRTRGACPPVETTFADTLRGGVDRACSEWLSAMLDDLVARPPELVVAVSFVGSVGRILDAETGRPLPRDMARQHWLSGQTRLLRRLRDAGIAVVVVPGPPRGRFRDLAACLRLGTEADQCGLPRNQAVYGDPVDLVAARQVPGVHIVDLTDRFCGPNVCYPVRGGLIVYRDAANHLTAAFSRSLAPDFAVMLERFGSSRP